MTKEKDSDFLSRWSARKRGVAAETTDHIPPAPPLIDTPAPPTDTPPDLSPEEQDAEDRSFLQELGLKHPDELQPGDDVKGFMQAVVPDRLRRLALRQLWRGNPVLANLDQLVDYGDDFTDSAMVVENMQTLYQVGKGMLRQVEELAEDQDIDEPSQPLTGEPPIAEEELEDAEKPAQPAPDPVCELPNEDGLTSGPTAEPDEPATSRRRMVFHFED